MRNPHWKHSPNLPDPLAAIRSHHAEGFSIVEVLVALLISAILVTVGLQMFLAATFLRVRAQQFSEAYNWIENDFEQVRDKATTFEQDAVPYSLLCDEAPNNNLAANFIGNDEEGLGNQTTNLGTREFSGQTYELIRTADYANTVLPDRLVALQYSLIPEGGGAPEIEIETEVVVYAAFQCP